MKNFIPLLTVFIVQLFFAILNILGYTYQGSSTSNIYIFINVIAFILSIVVFWYDKACDRFKFSVSQIATLGIVFLVLGIYLFEMLLGIINNSATQTFYYYCIWSVPSILMGIYYSKNNRHLYLIKYMEILMLIFTVSSVKSLIYALKLGTRATIGGATYQYAGYIAAFSFGLNLYYIFGGSNYERFEIFKLKFYRLLSYIMLVLQFITVVITGARGPMVLNIVYLIFIIYNNRLDMKSIARFIPIIVLGMVLIVFIWPVLMDIPVFERSWQRTFQFVSIKGINWDGTSGRGDIYLLVLEAIKQSPIYGYGFFGMWRVLNRYPHNLFLEILLQGGIILFIPFTVISFLLFRKLSKLIKLEPSLVIISIIALYPMVLLMFSGTYISQGLFWFILSFAINYTPKAARSYRHLINTT